MARKTECDWYVGLEQKSPYEFHVIEIFRDEVDAIAYAEKFMEAQAGRKIAKRTWLVIDNSDQNPRLIVRPYVGVSQ